MMKPPQERQRTLLEGPSKGNQQEEDKWTLDQIHSNHYVRQREGDIMVSAFVVPTVKYGGGAMMV